MASADQVLLVVERPQLVLELGAVPSSTGGSTDHALLSHLAWTASGHTGTASCLAGWDGAGDPAVVALSSLVASSDPRLTDARTPTTHASTHKHGGSDEVAALSPAAFWIPKADANGTLDAWISSATTTVWGLVKLGAAGGAAAYAAILATLGALANGAGWLRNNGAGALSWTTPTASDVGALATGVAAGGDLSGTLPSPTVARLAGTTPTALALSLIASSTAAAWRLLLGVFYDVYPVGVGVHGVQVRNGTTTTTVSTTANRQYYAKWVGRNLNTWSAICVEVTTIAAAGKLGQLALYKADSAGKPAGLIWYSATFAVDALGVKTASIASTGTWVDTAYRTGTAGAYAFAPGAGEAWFASFMSDGTPVLKAYTTGTAEPIWGHTAGSLSTQEAVAFHAQTFGSGFANPASALTTAAASVIAMAVTAAS